MSASDHLNGQQFSRLSPRMKKHVRSLRTQERGNLWYGEGGGQCDAVSPMVRHYYGFPVEQGGYSVHGLGAVKHEWNRLPDGRILDTTADQFEDDTHDQRGIKSGRGVRIVGPTHPDYPRYQRDRR